MDYLKKTKIICTLGPAVSTLEMVKDLIEAGMNAARFNFSHGSHEEHLERLKTVQTAREELGVPVATILDTKGPEIRIKQFVDGKVSLVAGEKFILTTDEVAGTVEKVSVTYNKLHEEVKVGDHILIDDGLVDLIVLEVSGKDIICNIENGGGISNNKSVNLPGVKIQLPALSEKDIEDLKFACLHNFDYIAASFVRSAADVEHIREVLQENGGEGIHIIAKIENMEGVENLDEILEVSDALMVARGDLGIEVPVPQVPILQKEMIKKCMMLGKPVITATQMLDSMMRNPRPTRAEVSDVANAVFDGSSCVMLSGETAAGAYPLEAVKLMADIVVHAEKSIDYWDRFKGGNHFVKCNSISNAISLSCCTTAKALNATAILAATHSGYSARIIARFRPACPIVAFTSSERMRRQLAICWGVQPYVIEFSKINTDVQLAMCVDYAKNVELIQKDDVVVHVAGTPIGQVGSTNLIKVQVVE